MATNNGTGEERVPEDNLEAHIYLAKKVSDVAELLAKVSKKVDAHDTNYPGRMLTEEGPLARHMKIITAVAYLCAASLIVEYALHFLIRF